MLHVRLHRPQCYWSCLCCYRMMPTVKTCINHSLDQKKKATTTTKLNRKKNRAFSDGLYTFIRCMLCCAHHIAQYSYEYLKFYWRRIEAWTMGANKKTPTSTGIVVVTAHLKFLETTEYYFCGCFKTKTKNSEQTFPQLKCQLQQNRQSKTIKHWINQ